MAYLAQASVKFSYRTHLVPTLSLLMLIASSAPKIKQDQQLLETVNNPTSVRRNIIGEIHPFAVSSVRLPHKTVTCMAWIIESLLFVSIQNKIQGNVLRYVLLDY